LANKDSQRSSIGTGKGGVCDIYSNFIKEGGSKGIRAFIYGNLKIYNNVIVNSGQLDPAGGDGIWILKDDGVAGKSVVISNNTIVNPSANGISFGFPLDSNSRIQNNIIINPGNFGTVGNEAYIQVSTPSNVIVSNNFTTLNINEAKFANPGADDYSLLPDSPVIDAGANLNDEGIVLDFIGTPRPQGISLDIGAYEFR
jgi:hypothetical protein